MFFLAKLPFSEDEVRDYERRRYRGLDQRLVHSREVRILEKILRLIEPTPGQPPGPPGPPGPPRPPSSRIRAGIPAEDNLKKFSSPELKGESSRKAAIPADRRASPDRPPPWAFPPSPQLALDAPCGYGRFSNFLLQKGYRLVSADLSRAMVERACRRATIYSIPMGIVCDLTQGLPFRPCVFSLILSMRLFHHLHAAEERQKVWREFERVAGGWVIVSYYQANLLHRWQRRLRRLIKKSRTRIRMLRRREFQDEARAAGLDIVRVFPLFRGIHGQHIALLKKG